MIGRFWCTARIISPAIRSRSAQTNGLITSGFPILSLTEAPLSIVQRTQAIEQMLNAGWWPRLFFREQNPKPLSYFRTDESKMAELDGQEGELRDDLMRLRALEAETTDPLAKRFLHEIVVDLETELDQRHRVTRAQSHRL